MPEFIRCPECGHLDELRSRCRCGYDNSAPLPLSQAGKRRRNWLASWSLVLLLVGIGLFVWGCQEYVVSHGAAAEPLPIELESLEAGGTPTQNHIRIGKHMRLYSELIFVISERQKDAADPLIRYSFYPILSTENPLLSAFNEGGDAPKVRNTIGTPIHSFRVLVKTSDFSRKSQLPAKSSVEESIEGLVINRISSLTPEEVALIKESFPEADESKLLVLEQGRRPASLLHSFGFIGAGALLLLIAVCSLVRGFRTR